MSAVLLLALLASNAPTPQAPARADLAVSYLRFEQALRAYPPEEARRVAVERAFDAATTSFFTGEGARALEQLDALASELDPAPASVADRVADALALECTPREVVSGTGGALTLKLVALRELPELPVAQRFATVRVVMPTAAGARVLATQRIALPESGAVDARLAVPGGGDFPAARIDLALELEVAGAQPRRMGSVALVGVPLATLRRDLERRLARIEPDGPPLVQALAACKARARLLDAEPSRTDSTRFLLELAAHAAEVELEVAALEQGRDPYRRRVGDLWRVVVADGTELPVRIQAPDAARGDAPLPLVVALHGAGGDENMFFTGYGLGRLRDQARERGFVAVCPRAGFGGISPAAFDALIEALLYTYAIDVQRIHVLGHSLGAGGAAALRNARPRRIASAVLLAGAPRAGGDAQSPPQLVIAGELDAFASIASIRRACDLVRAEGAPLELRVEAGRGHTLFVGDVLPAALSWSLSHARKP